MASELIEAIDSQGVSVLAINGSLDLQTAPELEAAIQKQIRRKRFRIVIDCTDLHYISSAGLGVFMGYVDEIRDNGGDIIFCHVRHDKVREIFRLVNFGELFDIVADREEAIRRFSV